MLRKFADLHRNDAAKLEDAARAEESEEACRIAHSLKGAAGSLGLIRVQAEAAALEAALDKGGPRTRPRPASRPWAAN
ncbi:Hpt domain-containing protein [Chromobacterium haemolyticum]|nr:Hpt domain-containing protein [Chromobacterium haemolyticum]